MITVQSGPNLEVNGEKCVRKYLEVKSLNILKDVELGWVEWFASDWGELELDNVRFRRCDFTTADFSRCKFRNVIFEECTLVGVTFPEDAAGSWTCIKCHESLSVSPPWL